MKNEFELDPNDSIGEEMKRIRQLLEDGKLVLDNLIKNTVQPGGVEAVLKIQQDTLKLVIELMLKLNVQRLQEARCLNASNLKILKMADKKFTNDKK